MSNRNGPIIYTSPIELCHMNVTARGAGLDEEKEEGGLSTTLKNLLIIAKQC